MAEAMGTRTASLVASQARVFPTIRPYRSRTLYQLAAHLRALAAHEPDYHRRRILERRSIACQRAAREALRATFDGDHA